MRICEPEPKRSRDRWEIEDDLRVLKRAEEIKRDPERIRDAKALLKEQRSIETSIMGVPTPPTTPGRKNPATIMQLKTKF